MDTGRISSPTQVELQPFSQAPRNQNKLSNDHLFDGPCNILTITLYTLPQLLYVILGHCDPLIFL